MKLPKKLFAWIFKKQIATIIYNHSKSIQLREVIEVNRSALSVYIEVLEFNVVDINRYFTPHSGLSARKAMREIRDFSSHKLATLKKLQSEYDRIEGKE